MAIKRTSLRGKGASIFFGDDEEQVKSEELSNSETIEPTPAPRPQQPTSDKSTPQAPRLPESQSYEVGNSDSFNDHGVLTAPRPVSNSTTSKLSQSNPRQAANLPNRGASSWRDEPTTRGRQSLQSSIVANSRTGRVDDFDPAARRRAQRGTSIADETRAEYRVEPDDEQGSYPAARQMSFSEFYSSGEAHYLMLEPLATRLTTEQMDRLSALERRIHQGRQRKEPRVTKNSIIRALLEATFDLDLDTRDINSEMELVNRFREALHLASLVRETQD